MFSTRKVRRDRGIQIHTCPVRSRVIDQNMKSYRVSRLRSSSPSIPFSFCCIVLTKRFTSSIRDRSAANYQPPCGRSRIPGMLIHVPGPVHRGQTTTKHSHLWCTSCSQLLSHLVADFCFPGGDISTVIRSQVNSTTHALVSVAHNIHAASIRNISCMSERTRIYPSCVRTYLVQS